jgi:hypothetical protein
MWGIILSNKYVSFESRVCACCFPHREWARIGASNLPIIIACITEPCVPHATFTTSFLKPFFSQNAVACKSIIMQNCHTESPHACSQQQRQHNSRKRRCLSTSLSTLGSNPFTSVCVWCGYLRGTHHNPPVWTTTTRAAS